MNTRHTLQTVPALAFFLMFNYAFPFSDDKKKHTSPVSDTSVCLEVSGKLAEEMKINTGHYTVKLLQDNKVVDKIMVSATQKFKFNLKKNEVFTIKIEKPGFLPRLISVSTQLPSDAKKSILYKFHFDIELFAEAFSKYFDADDIDFPIALISYDSNRGVFDYDKNYTEKIQSKMHGMSSTGK